MNIPDWYSLALLTLGAYRLYRLLARDTITEPLRTAATYPDDQAVTLAHEPADRIEVVGQIEGFEVRPLRVYLSTLLRCPWCLGAWCSLAIWSAWLIAPRFTLWVCVPLAISALIGFAAKTLDG